LQINVFISMTHCAFNVAPYCFADAAVTLASAARTTERKSAGFEDEETELFIEVDCFNVEPVLGPAPEGLSQQQVPSMHFPPPETRSPPIETQATQRAVCRRASLIAVCDLLTAGEEVYLGIDTGE